MDELDMVSGAGCTPIHWTAIETVHTKPGDVSIEVGTATCDGTVYRVIVATPVPLRPPTYTGPLKSATNPDAEAALVGGLVFLPTLDHLEAAAAMRNVVLGPE